LALFYCDILNFANAQRTGNVTTRTAVRRTAPFNKWQFALSGSLFGQGRLTYSGGWNHSGSPGASADTINQTCVGSTDSALIYSLNWTSLRQWQALI